MQATYTLLGAGNQRENSISGSIYHSSLAPVSSIACVQTLLYSCAPSHCLTHHVSARVGNDSSAKSLTYYDNCSLQNPLPSPLLAYGTMQRRKELLIQCDTY
jgi:hypothetical protein